jgi:hypothetical protein
VRPCLFAAAITLAAPAALAEIVDIQWPADGRFQHATTLAPGKFLELCGKLPAQAQVRWQFEAGAAMDFNVHFHVGKEVVYPFKLKAVTSGQEVLDAKIAQDYCWMWTNKSTAPASLNVTLQR